MRGTWLSPGVQHTLAYVLMHEDVLARESFLRSCAVLPEDVDGLAAAYRLGGLEALADAAGRCSGRAGGSS